MATLKELKDGGFLPQKQKDRFSMRIKAVGGSVTAADMKILADVAEKYGAGKFHLTSRQTLEIPFIKLEDVETVRALLEGHGIEVAKLGPSVRTITACHGAALCPSGLIDTQAVAQLLQKNLADDPATRVTLPRKLKVGVTGCHNNCLKPEENDIGVKGACIPTYAQPDKCVHCGLCQKICPAGAIEVTKTELKYDAAKCYHCGRCFLKCPKHCWEGEIGMDVFAGGLFSNTIQPGRQIGFMLKDEAALLKTVRRALEWFSANAKPGERFGRALNRVGWENFNAFMAQ